MANQRLVIVLLLSGPVLASELRIAFDKDGNTIGEVPAIAAGDSLRVTLPEGMKMSYLFSNEIGNGYRLDCDSTGGPKPKAYDLNSAISIPTAIESSGGTGARTSALYFNLSLPMKISSADDRARLKDLNEEYVYLSGLNHPMDWGQRRKIEEEIADKQDLIAQLQDEIKPYTGISLAAAVDAINKKQVEIRALRKEIRGLERNLSDADLKEQLAELKIEIDDLCKKIEDEESATSKIVREGVLIVGRNRKPVYYSLRKSGDKTNPYLLKHFQRLPILTTDDIPYVVILGQHDNDDPQGMQASFTSQAGSYIDVDPVRPLVQQPAVPSVAQGGGSISSKFLTFTHVNRRNAPSCSAVAEDALVDRVLTFTDRLAGETVYSLTVTGYGVATTTDQTTVTTGTNASTQHEVQTTYQDLNLVNKEALPQVHSLYRYNLAAGVVWTSLRSPSFSRIPSGPYVPSGCDPSVAGTATCSPTYNTVRDSGGPRILPALMFTVYPWFKPDTQVPVKWKELIPSPTVGLSLASPTEDFFLGASSELKPLRNIQLVYGLHLGRIPKLGANSLQIPTDGTAPQTTTTLEKGGFVGLTFNVDFIKGLFGK